MDILHVRCAVCGEVWGEVESLDLRVFTTRSAGSWVSYRCPIHRGRVSCRISSRTREALRRLGYLPVDVPAEVLEIHHGPPLSTDELIELHFDLEDSRWLDRLRVSLERRVEPDCLA